MKLTTAYLKGRQSEHHFIVSYNFVFMVEVMSEDEQWLSMRWEYVPVNGMLPCSRVWPPVVLRGSLEAYGLGMSIQADLKGQWQEDVNSLTPHSRFS